MFDVLTLNEWEGTTKSLPFSLRYGILSFYEDYANKDYISVLEQERIHLHRKILIDGHKRLLTVNGKVLC